MSLEGLLRTEGFDRLFFDGEGRIFGLELYVFESGAEQPIHQELSYSQLGDWLHQRGDFKKYEQTLQPDFKGGLRVLFQPWLFGETNPAPVRKTRISNGKNCTCLPLKSASTLSMIIDTLKLPPSYPHDLAHRLHVPVRLSRVPNGERDNIGIVCQSPDFPESFMTMALSYNPVTRITSGFCGHTCKDVEVSYDPVSHITSGFAGYKCQRAEKAPLISNLLQAKSNAYHPMLLPALAFGIFWDRLRGQIKDVRLAMQDVQDKTGLLKDYLKLTNIARQGNRGETDDPQRAATKPDDAQRRGKKAHTDYNVLHKRLVEQQARMTNGLADFLSDLGPACRSALSEIGNESSGSDGADDDTNDTEPSIDDDELHTYVQYLHSVAKIELQYRDQLLSRVDMQLKVLYNLMQQRIAQETGRDSSAMKSIALLTMLFLPSTALATIFSMSSFFSAGPDGAGLQVSDKFWIFWAFAIPLTVLVVSIFALWIQRHEISEFAKAVMHAWYKQKQLDLERGTAEKTSVSGKA